MWINNQNKPKLVIKHYIKCMMKYFILVYCLLYFSRCGNTRWKLQWCPVSLPIPLQRTQLHWLHLWWASRQHEVVRYHPRLRHRPALWILPHGWCVRVHCFSFIPHCAAALHVVHQLFNKLTKENWNNCTFFKYNLKSKIMMLMKQV